jgi:hypothetical protein
MFPPIELPFLVLLLIFMFHLFQCDVRQPSEMQTCMVDYETGTSTQPHIAAWVFEFCPSLLIFCGTHNTKFVFIAKDECLL